MSYTVKKVVNFNGQDQLMTAMDYEFALHRTISIHDVIDDDLAGEVNATLRWLARENQEDDIILYIQSPGGAVSAGLSIYDTIQALKCDVVTVACGMTASMAAFLLAAGGTKGKRWCQPNAEVLIHQPLGGTNGQASDIRIYARNIQVTRARLNRILAGVTGHSEKKIERDTERDNIMSAEEALKYGLVDRIGDPISDW